MWPNSCKRSATKSKRSDKKKARASARAFFATIAWPANSASEGLLAPGQQRRPGEAQDQQRERVDREDPASRRVGSGTNIGAFRRRVEVHDLDHAQVVIETNNRGDRTDKGEPEHAR